MSIENFSTYTGLNALYSDISISHTYKEVNAKIVANILKEKESFRWNSEYFGYSDEEFLTGLYLYCFWLYDHIPTYIENLGEVDRYIFCYALNIGLFTEQQIVKLKFINNKDEFYSLYSVANLDELKTHIFRIHSKTIKLINEYKEELNKLI